MNSISRKWLLRFSRKARQSLKYLNKNDIFVQFPEQAINEFGTEDGDCNVKNGQPTLMNLLIKEHLKNVQYFTQAGVAGELKWVWVASSGTISLSLIYLL